jgi:hypothetical protein
MVVLRFPKELAEGMDMDISWWICYKHHIRKLLCEGADPIKLVQLREIELVAGK